MDIAIAIFEFVVLIFSAVLHEVAHGYEAERLGDPTARNAGRLTLNPLKHLEWFGSFILPVTLYILSGGAFFFAAAKPVPYNPNNLRDPRSGAAKIALAGPMTNLMLAVIFAIVLRVSAYLPVPSLFLMLVSIIVYLNIALGIFNLVPIPPLDGSKLLFALVPPSRTSYQIMYFLERYGLILVLIFVFFGFPLLIPIMQGIFTLITGQPLVF